MRIIRFFDLLCKLVYKPSVIYICINVHWSHLKLEFHIRVSVGILSCNGARWRKAIHLDSLAAIYAVTSLLEEGGERRDIFCNLKALRCLPASTSRDLCHFI